MRLIEATERLKEFPLSGRIIPEIKDPLWQGDYI
jgi:hypothetical protein